MAKTGKIKWEIDTQEQKSSKAFPIEEFQKVFFSLVESKLPKNELKTSCSKFESEIAKLDDAYKISERVFGDIPFLAAVLIAEKSLIDKSEEIPPYLREMKILIEEGFIRAKDDQENIWTLSHVARQDPNDIYRAIRCRRDLSMKLRESLVEAYWTILHHLDIITKGYLKHRENIDHEMILGRLIPYDFFVKFLDELSDKPQLVAKLLYFGGDRNLDEILQLQLKDVDFERRVIKFGSQEIEYPSHVFVDIKALCTDRKNGSVFTGRQNLPLNPATIFRNFKEAGIKLGLPAFSPSVLLRNL